MIELVDTSPGRQRAAGEYKRLLGYPRDWVVRRSRAGAGGLGARAGTRSTAAVGVRAARPTALEIGNDAIGIDGVRSPARGCRRRCRSAGAHGAVVVAVSAGPELEAEAQRLWQDGKPDEYFFLEVFGSAVVEHLVTMTGARLCAWAEGRQMAVLPHYSPGYPGVGDRRAAAASWT